MMHLKHSVDEVPGGDGDGDKARTSPSPLFSTRRRARVRASNYSNFFLIFLLFLLINTAAPVLSQNASPSTTPSPPGLPEFTPTKPEELDLNFGVSMHAPMARVLLRDSDLKSSYNKLLSFVKHVDDAVRYATSNESANEDRRVLTTCNHRNDGWRDDTETFFGVRGLSLSDIDCISDVYGVTGSDGLNYNYVETENTDKETDPRSFTADSVYDMVSKHSKLVADRAKEIVIESMWNATTAENATRAREFPYAVRTQGCTYDYVAFVNVSGMWHVVERVTNADRDNIQMKGNRRFIYEFISPNAVPNGAAPVMKFGNSTIKVQEKGIWYGVTTSGANHTGAVAGSAFGTVFAADNLAVQRALQRGEHQTQQANDATTPSNVAILIFPLVMNMVPVALIADVNTIGMLLYTLLTDVLTAVPLAIKGIEVLLIGSRANRAVVTRISGANAKTNLKAAETWVAQCRATGSFTATGVIFLVVALAFMVGGIAAEFWAKRYVARRKKAKAMGGLPTHWNGYGNGKQYGLANGGGGGGLSSSGGLGVEVPPHSVGASSADSVALLAQHALRQQQQSSNQNDNGPASGSSATVSGSASGNGNGTATGVGLGISTLAAASVTGVSARATASGTQTPVSAKRHSGGSGGSGSGGYVEGRQKLHGDGGGRQYEYGAVGAGSGMPPCPPSPPSRGRGGAVTRGSGGVPAGSGTGTGGSAVQITKRRLNLVHRMGEGSQGGNGDDGGGKVGKAGGKERGRKGSAASAERDEGGNKAEMEDEGEDEQGAVTSMAAPMAMPTDIGIGARGTPPDAPLVGSGKGMTVRKKAFLSNGNDLKKRA